MESPGFLLDEHITPIIQAQLLAREPNQFSNLCEMSRPTAPLQRLSVFRLRSRAQRL